MPYGSVCLILALAIVSLLCSALHAGNYQLPFQATATFKHNPAAEAVNHRLEPVDPDEALHLREKIVALRKENENLSNQQGRIIDIVSGAQFEISGSEPTFAHFFLRNVITNSNVAVIKGSLGLDAKVISCRLTVAIRSASHQSMTTTFYFRMSRWSASARLPR